MKWDRSKLEDRLRILYNVVIALLGGALRFADYNFPLSGFLGAVLDRHGKRKKRTVGNGGSKRIFGRTRNDGVHLERVSAIVSEPRVFSFVGKGQMDI